MSGVMAASSIITNGESKAGKPPSALRRAAVAAKNLLIVKGPTPEEAWDAEVRLLKIAPIGAVVRYALSQNLSSAKPGEFSKLAYGELVQRLHAASPAGREKMLHLVEKAAFARYPSKNDYLRCIAAAGEFFAEAAVAGHVPDAPPAPEAKPGKKPKKAPPRKYAGVIARFTRELEHTEYYLSADPRHDAAKVAAAKALWAMDEGDFAFWQQRLNSPATRDFMITACLEMPATEDMAEHGWHLLKENLEHAGKAILASQSQKKQEFILHALQDSCYNRQAALLVADDNKPAAEAIPLLSKPVQEAILSCADEGKAGEADRFIRELLTTVIRRHFTDVPEMQAVISSVAGHAVSIINAPEGEVQRGVVDKAAQVVVFLTASGALPRRKEDGAAPELEGSDELAILRARDILLGTVMEEVHDRMDFGVAHDLASITERLSGSQLAGLGDKMANIVAVPLYKNNGKKDEWEFVCEMADVQRGAVGVLAKLAAARVNGEPAVDGGRVVEHFRKTFSEFGGVRAVKAMQAVLDEHAQRAYYDDSSTQSAIVLSEFIRSIVPYLPEKTCGGDASGEYGQIIRSLRHISESREGFDYGSAIHARAASKATLALWHMGYEAPGFWEERIRDPATAAITVNSITEAGVAGRAGKANREFLESGLDSVHPLGWENAGKETVEFVSRLITHSACYEAKAAALRVATYLPEVPGCVVAAARTLLPDGRKDRGDDEVRNAASVFLTAREAKDGLYHVNTIVPSAHTLLTLHGAGNEHLGWAAQRAGFLLASVAFPSRKPVTVEVETDGDSTTVVTEPEDSALYGKVDQRAALDALGRFAVLGVPVFNVTFKVSRKGEAPVPRGDVKAAVGKDGSVTISFEAADGENAAGSAAPQEPLSEGIAKSVEECEPAAKFRSAAPHVSGTPISGTDEGHEIKLAQGAPGAVVVLSGSDVQAAGAGVPVAPPDIDPAKPHTLIFTLGPKWKVKDGGVIEMAEPPGAIVINYEPPKPPAAKEPGEGVQQAAPKEGPKEAKPMPFVPVRKGVAGLYDRYVNWTIRFFQLGDVDG